MLVAIPLAFAIKGELEDMYRPRRGAPTSEWQDGHGEHIEACRQGTPEERIRASADYIGGTVNWRRCVVAAIVGSFLFATCMWGRLPTGGELLMSVMTFGGLFLLVSNYHHYHAHRHVMLALLDAATELHTDCRSDPQRKEEPKEKDEQG